MWAWQAHGFFSKFTENFPSKWDFSFFSFKWLDRTPVPKNARLLHSSAGWQREFLPCPVLWPLHSALSNKWSSSASKIHLCSSLISGKFFTDSKIWWNCSLIWFSSSQILYLQPLKAMPCVTQSSSRPGKEQARTVPSWYLNFWVLWLCRRNEAFANTPITALPPLSSELPDHHFFSKAQPAASGLSGDGQVTGGVQREAGRQLQGSSSGKKTKIHPREDVCSHFSALGMPLTNVRTAENKKSLFTACRNYWQCSMSKEKMFLYVVLLSLKEIWIVTGKKSPKY